MPHELRHAVDLSQLPREILIQSIALAVGLVVTVVGAILFFRWRDKKTKAQPGGPSIKASTPQKRRKRS